MDFGYGAWAENFCVQGSQTSNKNLHFEDNPNNWNTWEITTGVLSNGDIAVRFILHASQEEHLHRSLSVHAQPTISSSLLNVIQPKLYKYIYIYCIIYHNFNLIRFTSGR